MSIITEALKKAQEKRLKKDDPSEMLLKHPLSSIMSSSTNMSTAIPKIKSGLLIGMNKPVGAAIIILAVIVFGSLTGILLHTIGSRSDSTQNKANQNTAQPVFYQNKNGSSKNAKTELISMRGRSLPILSGVMYSPVNPQAIVNGKMLSEGDNVGVFKLIKIYPASVKLSTGEEEFELKLR